MIRDFLDHLLWEYRINHFENTIPDPEKRIHPELCEQLKKYIIKYNTCGLMAATTTVPGDCSEDEIKDAEDIICKAKTDYAQKVIDALQVLESAFEQAFFCASHPNKFLARRITLSNFFDDDATEEDLLGEIVEIPFDRLSELSKKFKKLS